MAEMPIPDEELEPLTMPDGSERLIPKTWTRDEVRSYVKTKFPDAYASEGSGPAKGSAAYNAVDALQGFGGGVERGVAADLGLPGTLIQLGKNGLRGLGMEIPEEPLGGSPMHVQTGEELLGEYEKARGRKTYEPTTGWGEAAETVGSFMPGLIGGPAGLASRAFTNVAAPAAGAIAGGKIAEQLTLPKEVGETIGGLIGWGGATGARASRMPKSDASLPDVGELTTEAQLAAKAAEAAGVIVERKALSGLSGRFDPIRKTIDARAHPTASAVLKHLDKKMRPDATGKFTGTMTLDELETMRQNINSIGKNPPEAHLYFKLKREFDDFMENLNPKDVVNGNTKEGLTALKQFRKLWHRRKKTEEIEDMLDSAELRSLSGTEKGEMIKRKFTQYVDPAGAGKRNRKKFTPAEWDMLNEVAKGRPTEQVLRWVGEFAPGKLKGMLGAGAAYTQGGAEAALTVAAPTGASRWLANKMAQANAQRAYDSIRGGVPISAPPSAGAPAQLGTASAVLPFDLPPIKDYGKSEQELEEEEKLRREGEEQ